MHSRLIILFILTTRLVFGQNAFSKFNFDSGNYTIYGRKEINTENEFALRLGDFYTSDIKTLNDFNTEWNFESSDDCVCDFDYFITIVKSDSIVDEMALSLKCNRVMFDIDKNDCFFFRFDSSKVLRRPFNSLIREEKKYTEIAKARKFWTENKESKNIFVPLQAEFYWYKFDGSFEFLFNDTVKENNWEKTKTYLEHLFENKLMTNNFRLEYFKLEKRGDDSKPWIYHVRVYCNADFSKSFNLFEKEKEWTPIKDITFEVYHKK